VPGLPGVGLVEPGTGVTCPSCERELPGHAKICIGCGIKLDTGRPVILSAPADQEDLDRAAPWIKLLSWIMWVTPFPIPFMSEAFGTRKPWAIRGIAAVTILASVLFLFAAFAADGKRWDTPGKNLELWPPGMTAQTAKIDIVLTQAKVKRLMQQMDDDEAAQFMAVRERLRGTVPDADLDRRAMQEFLNKAVAAILGEPGQFQPHQLLTHALLHDNSSLWEFAAHLGGNLVFLLVFGSRINGVIGNVATLVVYPILAVGAALTHLWLGHPHGPMIGASGAIMGLAGMYLILFPVHRVYCGMWIRFRIWCAMKIFALRGFWILLIYFAFDMLMATLQAGSSTAHFAHIGGFVLGMILALIILASRQFNCGGGDLLSVTLGRYAWPLIGRPCRHLQQAPAA
jgi:membrane associated rhomboid family serine protease